MNFDCIFSRVNLVNIIGTIANCFMNHGVKNILMKWQAGNTVTGTPLSVYSDKTRYTFGHCMAPRNNQKNKFT